MNYQRIYDDFIADRRTAEDPTGLLDAYTEKHHILPRALGGDDSPSNLIRLTARDHYFAHCCLAKIHGGKMWAALRAMTQLQSAERRAALFVKGRLLGVIRREYAAHVGAETKRKWAAGVFANRPKFQEHTTASKRLMAEKATGRKHTSATKAKIVESQQRTATRYAFYESATGQVFEGTTLEFQRHSGVSQASSSKLALEQARTASGWVLLKNKGMPRGKRGLTQRIFKHHDGRVFEGTAYDFRHRFGLDSGPVSNVISGATSRNTVKGWRYAGEKEAA